MANEAKRVDALQLIFSVFLGLLLVVFIGVGVWTFYPQPYGPDSPEQQQVEETYREIERKSGGIKTAPTADEDVEIRRLEDKAKELNERMQVKRDIWARNTSIILLIFATVLMAISLFLPDMMRVFANGILLGGLFSVVYATGWSFAGGDSRARFYVVAVALALSLLFGYLRFVQGRQGKAGATQATGAVTPLAEVDQATLGDLVARVEALERRSAALADAFGGPKD